MSIPHDSPPPSTGQSLPPGQQLVARHKWPVIGESAPAAEGVTGSVAIAGLVDRELSLNLDELTSLATVDRTIDIHCVTRWSRPAIRFRGTPLTALLDQAGAQSAARYVIFTAHSDRDHSTSITLDDALALDVLLATHADDAPLSTEHGGPLRVIVPGRYFYKSLKWLARVELAAADRPGFWESTAGYHPVGDPWESQRYLAPDLTRADAESLLATKRIEGKHLRGLRAASLDLVALVAAAAILRDADFTRCRLAEADFSGANLSNARFDAADLRRANFRHADLEGADFTAADLRGVDFRGAALTAATFCRRSESAAPSRAARIDDDTRFSAKSLDALVEPQAEFVRASTATIVDG